MIDRHALLSDLQSLLRNLEADLLDRSDSAEVPEVGEWLRAEYARAKEAERTAQTEKQWIDDFITQVAAAWVLSCVFARFLEDNELVDPPRIAGPGKRLERARDEHTLFFQDPERARQTDREYLLDVFDGLARLPAGKDVFGPHNPMNVLPNWLGPDAAGELLKFFQRIDAETGELLHDFTDPDWDTRFLGDLYQDLSEAARKKYALLQTPEFVEEFILDRTLDPALDEFGLDAPPVLNADGQPITQGGFRMIDPACGSGHFLLGAFPRILDRWQKREPGANVRELVQRTLDSIHGVDVNPYAVSIARFRLLLAAMRACGVKRLADAPGFKLNLACGDSLLHAPLRSGQQVFDFELTSDDTECEHAYQSEDLPALKRMLHSGIYHAVVANPPYITPKDRKLNERYRRRFESCHMKYSLGVPFMERILRMAVDGGITGQITANSFMKREFGKKLIESFIPKVDLTHVIDTSGAYIPGHGTPTVILFGRNRAPVVRTIRTVMGIRGEPKMPDDPSQGLVWSAIVRQLDEAGSESEFISVSDAARERFHSHPWSVGGGGAAELKEQIDRTCRQKLDSYIEAAGPMAMTMLDEVFIAERHVWSKRYIATMPYITGESIRDWCSVPTEEIAFPYGQNVEVIGLSLIPHFRAHAWKFRQHLRSRLMFGKTAEEAGLEWYEYRYFEKSRAQKPMLIAFPCVATHNSFALIEQPVVANRHAPVISLKSRADRDTVNGLLGVLSSSVACFWMKQVFFPKGGDHVGQEGARVRRTWWDERYEFAATGMKPFPIPGELPTTIASALTRLANASFESSPARFVRQPDTDSLRADRLYKAESANGPIRDEMIRVQEDLDWKCYQLYGLIDEDLTYSNESFPIELGQRAFEIVLARKMVAGEVQTTWFERHGSTPITEIPADWPEDYRRLVERRIEVIETNPQIALIEQPEYKRRWNTEPWESQVERALRDWLLDRLESYFDFDGRMSDQGEAVSSQRSAVSGQENGGVRSVIAEGTTTSVGRLADIASKDEQFMEVGSVYRDDPAFNVPRLVEELVTAESVPLLPVLRYKPSGLRKREQWEETWELQRREDDISGQLSAISDQLEKTTDPAELEKLKADSRPLTAELEELTIPVPPKYKSSDFISTGGARYWSLRGKLDVPKERWISFPHCEGEDGTLMICWAGYDHLQQARAISAHYVDIQERLGGRDDPRLIPLLACLIELLPWLKQWHNDVDPEYGMAMGDYFEGFVTEEARNLGKTVEEIRAWEPPQRTGRRNRRRAAT